MATTNAINLLPVMVKVTDKVPGALADRFVTYQTSSAAEREVITLVPGAAGGHPVGILAENVPTDKGNGLYPSSIAVPDGSYPKVLLGENVTAGAPLRAGGNSTEVDGAAYLANAQNDIIIARAMEAGNAGEIIQIQFGPYGGLVP